MDSSPSSTAPPSDDLESLCASINARNSRENMENISFGAATWITHPSNNTTDMYNHLTDSCDMSIPSNSSPLKQQMPILTDSGELHALHTSHGLTLDWLQAQNDPSPPATELRQLCESVFNAQEDHPPQSVGSFLADIDRIKRKPSPSKPFTQTLAEEALSKYQPPQPDQPISTTTSLHHQLAPAPDIIAQPSTSIIHCCSCSHTSHQHSDKAEQLTTAEILSSAIRSIAYLLAPIPLSLLVIIAIGSYSPVPTTEPLSQVASPALNASQISSLPAELEQPQTLSQILVAISNNRTMDHTTFIALLSASQAFSRLSIAILTCISGLVMLLYALGKALSSARNKYVDITPSLVPEVSSPKTKRRVAVQRVATPRSNARYNLRAVSPTTSRSDSPQASVLKPSTSRRANTPSKSTPSKGSSISSIATVTRSASTTSVANMHSSKPSVSVKSIRSPDPPSIVTRSRSRAASEEPFNLQAKSKKEGTPSTVKTTILGFFDVIFVGSPGVGISTILGTLQKDGTNKQSIDHAKQAGWIAIKKGDEEVQLHLRSKEVELSADLQSSLSSRRCVVAVYSADDMKSLAVAMRVLERFKADSGSSMNLYLMANKTDLADNFNDLHESKQWVKDAEMDGFFAISGLQEDQVKSAIRTIGNDLRRILKRAKSED